MGLLRRPMSQMLTPASSIYPLHAWKQIWQQYFHTIVINFYCTTFCIAFISIHKSIWTTISYVLHPCQYLTNISALDTVIWICLREQLRIRIIFLQNYFIFYICKNNQYVFTSNSEFEYFAQNNFSNSIYLQGAVCCEGALCSIYLLDKEQILLTLFLADQISRLTNGEFNSLNLSTQEGGGNIFKGYKINPFFIKKKE